MNRLKIAQKIRLAQKQREQQTEEQRRKALEKIREIRARLNTTA